jgi:hypothetical protein
VQALLQVLARVLGHACFRLCDRTIDRFAWPRVRYQNLLLIYQARRVHGREVTASRAGRIALSIGEGHGVYPSIGAGIEGHRGYEQDELGQRSFRA